MPFAFLRRTTFAERVVQHLGAVSALAFIAACSGQVGNDQRPSAREDGTPGRDDDEIAKPPEAPSAGVDLTCDVGGITPGEAPLRRLTNAQFNNSLRDLFKGVLVIKPVELPAETPVGGYDNNVLGQFPAPTLLEGYTTAAKGIAQEAIATTVLQKIAPCSAGKDEIACGRAFLKDWSARIFRRPAHAEELGRLEALFKTSHAGDGYAAAVADTLQAMLSSPQFLYFLEGEGEATGNVVKLSGYEVASRLSYLLWDSIPDAELTEAAASDNLGSVASIEKQADRMMQDPRAKTAVARFHHQWLMLDKLNTIAKDAKLFPKWNEDVAKALGNSTAKYVEHIFWNAPTVANLLTDTHAFIEPSTSWIWGTSTSPAPAEMKLVDLGRGKRSGLLTQAGLMAAFAKPADDSSVFRGLFVMRQLLCSDVPEPPPGLNTTIPDPSPGSAPKTMRQRQEESHAAPTCAGCHASIDGIGFGFGHYDAVGAWRDSDNGLPVDASGELVNTRDVDGTFNGAVELGERLSQSVQVQQCIATHWFRWSFGRTETEADSCSLLPIVNRFVASKGDLRDLVKAIATSDAFRFRQRS